MESEILRREILPQIGALLEYPRSDLREILPALILRLESVSVSAVDNLKVFSLKMKRMEPALWQEYYVQTFDLMPSCALYLSMHLFGEESFKRAELMAGLKSVYERRDRFPLSELPDHLAVVLKKNVLLSPEEWREFVSLCLMPALVLMIKKMEKEGHPYGFVLKALRELLTAGECSYA